MPLLGISYGHTGGRELRRAANALFAGVGITYMLGGLLFGIATFRAGVLPRLPAGSARPRGHAHSPGGAAPARATAVRGRAGGVSLAWLGYALWSERRASAAQAAPATAGAQLRPAAAK